MEKSKRVNYADLELMNCRSPLIKFVEVPRKIQIHWTCSDFNHHEHKTWIGAWICGKIRRIIENAKNLHSWRGLFAQ